MKEIREMSFTHHCDPPCGLGYAEFICPFCGEYTKDFDEVWYHFSGYPFNAEDDNKDSNFNCEQCNHNGIIVHEDCDYFLKDDNEKI